MRRKKSLFIIASLIIALILPVLMTGCGTVRGHWGIEHEYEFPDDGYHHHKKHKKKKHKKHHHHDHDSELDTGEF